MWHRMTLKSIRSTQNDISSWSMTINLSPHNMETSNDSWRTFQIRPRNSNLGYWLLGVKVHRMGLLCNSCHGQIVILIVNNFLGNLYLSWSSSTKLIPLWSTRSPFHFTVHVLEQYNFSQRINGKLNWDCPLIIQSH